MSEPCLYNVHVATQNKHTQIVVTVTQPCITEIFHGINFHPCGKDHHRVYVIINMGQMHEPLCHKLIYTQEDNIPY